MSNHITISNFFKHSFIVKWALLSLLDDIKPFQLNRYFIEPFRYWIISKQTLYRCLGNFTEYWEKISEYLNKNLLISYEWFYSLVFHITILRQNNEFTPTFVVSDLMTPPPPPRCQKCENSGKLWKKNQGTLRDPLLLFEGPRGSVGAP